MTRTIEEERVIVALKESIRGLVTYKDIAKELNITISAVSNVFNFYSPYNQNIIDKALELKNIALQDKAIHVQSTAKKIGLKI